ncbi:SIS domain-containing protein [Fervidibacillus halotolerans]|uniref:SIS domain-containing protein n=1 Tax=Fervidibacillus halotolerans TaxID=2980027 RepID=A0A9E8M190_9BACI|nr:SIS domain-containing protein [Fervidibacillus halotolerans]WAA13102.1 SIS domain-containing protein [Fervidibacillus halotolerans]
MFNLTMEELTEKKGIFTAKEIVQQPEVWRKVYEDFIVKKELFKMFMNEIIEKHERIRIIFTGAGTSAFIGDTIVPELRCQGQSQYEFEAIPTTDIVASPKKYLVETDPTILVSFARSGNSPESVAAVKIAKEYINDLYQVVITCNKQGELAKNTVDDPKSFLFLLPDEAHDKGFAMTSSFSGMALAAYLLFSSDSSFTDEDIARLIESGKSIIPIVANTVDDLLSFDFKRIVYLGSGSFGQLSHEAALKMLELTAGKTVAIHESSLGFRHGPKSILNEETLVVLFVSQDEYTKKYDLDMLREIKGDGMAKVVVLMPKKDEEMETFADWLIPIEPKNDKWKNDFLLTIQYIIFAQTLALKKSLSLGITPDNPSPEGRVNRVVKGVTIYPWEN